MTKNTFYAGISIAAFVIVAGCSKNSHNSSDFPFQTLDFRIQQNTFSAVYRNTLSTACIQCHQPGGSATENYGVELDFSTQSQAYSSLRGVVSSVTSKDQCPSVSLVSPGNPQDSYLLAEVSLSFASGNFSGVSGCTPAAVHYSILNLSPEQVDSMAAWIQTGAKNN